MKSLSYLSSVSRALPIGTISSLGGVGTRKTRRRLLIFQHVLPRLNQNRRRARQSHHLTVQRHQKQFHPTDSHHQSKPQNRGSRTSPRSLLPPRLLHLQVQRKQFKVFLILFGRRHLQQEAKDPVRLPAQGVHAKDRLQRGQLLR